MASGDERPSVTLIGEDVPRWMSVTCRPATRASSGSLAGPVVPTREWRELYAAHWTALRLAAIHPFYTRF